MEYPYRRAALINAFNKQENGFMDYYTNTLITEPDWRKPLSLSFDHRIPGDKKTMVVCFRCFNWSKSDMTDIEFVTMMERQDLHFRHIAPFSLDGLEFKYWNRKPRQIFPPAARHAIPPPGLVERVCRVCKKPIPAVYTYCSRCGRLRRNDEISAHVEALIKSYDSGQDAFLCKYTRLPADELDYHSVRYLSYDHGKPGQRGNISVTLFIINAMKANLGAEEYRPYVKEFAACRRECRPFNKKVVKFKYWNYRGNPRPEEELLM